MDSSSLPMIRRFLLWYLRYPPANPYVSYSLSCDFSAAASYLAELAAAEGPRVSVQHLLVAAVARVYAEFPQANASVIGRRIARHPHVGVTIPVDLGQTRRGATGAVLLERAEALPLREVAARVRDRVSAERGQDAPQNAFFRASLPLVERLPDAVLHRALDVADRIVRIPFVAHRIHALFPLTVIVSNVGAALPLPPGILGRSATAQPAPRLFNVGSILGVFPLQDEVIAIDGEVQIRKMLPLSYIFDHRLFDGVLAGRLLGRLAEVLLNPATVFGPDGLARPGS